MTTTRVFRGEGDLMVDALIAASQAKPSDNGPQMPGFGRDLVPFFDTEMFICLRSKRCPGARVHIRVPAAGHGAAERERRG